MTQLDRIEAMLMLLVESLADDDDPPSLDLQGVAIPKDRDENQPL